MTIGVYDRSKSVRKTNPAYFKTLDRILDDLFQEAVEQGYTWNSLATESRLTYVTVKNLGERWTRYPQLRTVIAIATVLGYDLQVSKGVPAVSRAAA